MVNFVDDIFGREEKRWQCLEGCSQYLTRVMPFSETSWPTLSSTPSTRSHVLQFLLSGGRRVRLRLRCRVEVQGG